MFWLLLNMAFFHQNHIFLIYFKKNATKYGGLKNNVYICGRSLAEVRFRMVVGAWQGT